MVSASEQAAPGYERSSMPQPVPGDFFLVIPLPDVPTTDIIGTVGVYIVQADDSDAAAQVMFDYKGEQELTDVTRTAVFIAELHQKE